MEIFYKDHKLFSMLEEDFAGRGGEPATVIVAVDNLDDEGVRENH